ncbi:deoxyribose-phosphate aldolase [Nonlabens dokdonensis]|jgi:deoxyribose-phosphate aldolase|uniref:Deoxyribose-phosphate aldolase n=2 Tax=Nonlabens dokdonensis TaxID=328515 RepID=L7W1J8_NONDD|nr:deoxyribose-phosphate aldolase [Nonlabens dokdonensis]AGC75335.1 deoxyribose-phosphate aldolase [Nonlabens dokdonensis DSW-6]PZX43043.1 deoxyribose-phosphate aldolase [Nonlabens dokdonensis]
MKINKHIEHTNLDPTFSDRQIGDLCQEVRDHSFYGVCVRPGNVFACAEEFTTRAKESIATVVGFPFGATNTTSLLEEVKYVVDYVSHIDMVMDLHSFHSGRTKAVLDQIKAVRDLASEVQLRVIVETGYLNEDQLKQATEIVLKTQADCIKTCTGYGPRGVSMQDIQIIKSVCGVDLGIKASGGIKNYQFACDLINAGATVLGTSAGLDLMKQQKIFLR